ncbi:MAG: hypothetical protein HOQ05_06415 [Corynebacteriales bacterium]|nr:hypothetical protein [Mycobacteriales bacterium]
MTLTTAFNAVTAQRAQIVASVTSGAIALSIMLALAAIQELSDLDVFSIPYIASAAVVAMAPTAPLSRPRAIVLSYPTAVVTALIVTAITGPSIYAAAAGVAIAITLMAALKAPHAPAIAAAALIGLTDPGPGYLLDPLLIVLPVVIGVALLAGWLLPNYNYPATWK